MPTLLSLKPTGGSLREDHTTSPEAQRGKGTSVTGSGQNGNVIIDQRRNTK